MSKVIKAINPRKMNSLNNYPREESSSSTEMNDIDMNCDSSVTDTEYEEDKQEDIEYQLLHLKEYDNLKQLDLLRREIGHIAAHGIIPSEGWYDDRFPYITIYSKIDWSNLAERHKNKDVYIYNTAIFIIRLINELLEERSYKPNFTIKTYYALIHNIQSIWTYYNSMYIGDEEDNDVIDLIEGMKFL